MNNCQNCGNSNLDTSRFCDECGTKLMAAVEAASGAPLYEPPVADAPPARPVSVTSVGIPALNDNNIESNGRHDDMPSGDGSSMNAVLEVERGDLPGVEFPIVGAESTIGRWDADNGVFPDVDLDAHDGEAKVSRRHARIKIIDRQYIIEDLGSTNGTYVNRGRRLLPGNPQKLNDGDEVIVGKTFMRFRIES